jgi:antitoxin component of MazEF toxin-antitoxin module
MKYKIQENSQKGVGLPNLTSIFKVLGWKKGDTLEITLENGKLIVQKES